MKLFTSVFLSLVLAGCLTTDPGFEKRGKVTADPPGVHRGYYPINGQYHPVIYEYIDGIPMTGGDMGLDPKKLLKAPPSEKGLARTSATVVPARWPSRFIPVFIDVPDIPANNDFRSAIYNGIMQYNWNTNLYFNIVSEAPETGSYIRIVEGGGDYVEVVGYRGPNTEHTVFVSSTTTDGSVAHELGHILGLYHEHQRPDRHLYIDTLYRNWCGHPDVARVDRRARQGAPHNDTGKYDCKHWASNMARQSGTTGYGPLDFHSIMIYSSTNLRFANPSYGHFDQPSSGSPFIGPDFYGVMPGLKTGWGYPTMIRKGHNFETDDSAYFFGNTQLSSQDIATINSLFPLEAITVGWIDMGNCSETPLQIFQEDENTGNATSGRRYQYYSTPPISQPAYSGTDGIYKYIGPSTIMNICPEDRSELPTLRDDYAVLKLSSECPLNSYAFSRTADNENTTNANGSTGDISPSTTTQGSPHSGSTTLHFCFVPGDGAVNSAAQPTPPWYDLKAGAFTRGNFQALESSDCYYQIHVQDDEDASNAFASGGNYAFETAAEPFASRIKWLFNNSQTETHYHWHACVP